MRMAVRQIRFPCFRVRRASLTDKQMALTGLRRWIRTWNRHEPERRERMSKSGFGLSGYFNIFLSEYRTDKDQIKERFGRERRGWLDLENYRKWKIISGQMQTDKINAYSAQSAFFMYFIADSVSDGVFLPCCGIHRSQREHC